MRKPMKIKRGACVILALCLMICSMVTAHAEEGAVPKAKHASVHDPSIIRAEDGCYYIFGSHMTAARSEDLIRWEMISTNANYGGTLVENVQEEMKEALTYARTNTFWAPDVIQLEDGRYYMYYCLSFYPEIGVAVSDYPAGPFAFLGHVHYPKHILGGKTVQEGFVFDPAVLTDEDGSV